MGRFSGFRQWLEKTKPELSDYVIEVGNKFESYYKIESDEDAFRIEVGNDEALVIIGSFHSHFDYPDMDAEELYADIVEMCSKYQNEELVLTYVYDKTGTRSRTCLGSPDASILVPEGGRIRVRSWKGTYDT